MLASFEVPQKGGSATSPKHVQLRFALIVDFLVPPSVLRQIREAVFSRYHFEPTVFRAGFYTVEIYLLRPGGEEFLHSVEQTVFHNMSQHVTACHSIAPAQCHQKGATPVLVLPSHVEAEGVLRNTDRIGQVVLNWKSLFFFKVGKLPGTRAQFRII